MKYSKSYIDKLFNSINEYTSKIELINIAYGEIGGCSESDKEWIIELSEIMNWQAVSDRSGVWTYYEVLDDNSAKVMNNSLKNNRSSQLLAKYNIGIGRYEDESLMNKIDIWIRNNETEVYKYIKNILLKNKNWFNNI